MLTEGAVRTIDRVLTPERRRLAVAHGVPLTDAANLDPRLSVAAVLISYSVLLIALLLVGATLIAAHVSDNRVVSAAWQSALKFVGTGGVLQGARAAVIYPLLRNVQKGQWHPSLPWHEALAYPRDTDFILQAVVVFLLR